MIWAYSSQINLPVKELVPIPASDHKLNFAPPHLTSHFLIFYIDFQHTHTHPLSVNTPICHRLIHYHQPLEEGFLQKKKCLYSTPQQGFSFSSSSLVVVIILSSPMNHPQQTPLEFSSLPYETKHPS